MHSYLFIWTFLIFVQQFSNVFAVSDDNICEGPPCQFCCKNKMCRSEDECKGNFQPLIIVGIVVGSLIGLFILSRLYVYYRSKNPKPQNKGKKPRVKSSRNWRNRDKSPKPEKESKSKKKAVKKEVRDKSDVYLQVDDGSVISPDITIKVEAPNDNPTSERKVESNNELKPKSKTDVASQNEIKDKEMTASKANGKSTDKSEAKPTHWTSAKKDAPSKDKDKKGKDGKDKDGKDRGRSKSGNKDRSSSQKKPSSKGPGDKKSNSGKDMKSSMRSSKKN